MEFRDDKVARETPNIFAKQLNLAPSARSNPTPFQAARFQPPDPDENREYGGIQAKRARGIRSQNMRGGVWSSCGVQCRWIASIRCCRHRRFWLARSWRNTSKDDRRVTCRLNFQSCENNIGEQHMWAPRWLKTKTGWDQAVLKVTNTNKQSGVVTIESYTLAPDGTRRRPDGKPITLLFERAPHPLRSKETTSPLQRAARRRSGIT